MSRAVEFGLVERFFDDEHRALARAIIKIEPQSPGYRNTVLELHAHTGDVPVAGITGSPGVGKSTLVDKLAKYYRDQGEMVGVTAMDPSPPYTGGAVLGDRIRMAPNVGNMGVFLRSMSARDQLGGFPTVTVDAVKAFDAFGKDRIIIETVGAGQSEVDVVKIADAVVVLVQPGSGDDVQMLKAGILEIGDMFVANKVDTGGASHTVTELQEVTHLRDNPQANPDTDHRRVTAFDDGHGGGHSGHADASDAKSGAEDDPSNVDEPLVWAPQVLETAATTGEGIDELVETLDDHRDYLDASGELAEKTRKRTGEEIRQHLRSDVNWFLEVEFDRRGGVEEFAQAVVEKETDPYAVAEDVFEPLRERPDDRAD